MKYIIYIFSAVLLFSSYIDLNSKSFRVNQIPYGKKYSCGMCHNSQFGGDARNAFGQTVEDNMDFNGNARWDRIFNIDSDGDGFTNGEELQDRNGEWVEGNPDPGNEELVTKPWDDTDPPPAYVESSNFATNINLYPLPVAENLNISFTSEFNSQVTISIIDILGKELYQEMNYINSGSNDLTIQLSDKFKQGTYFLIVRNEKYIIRKKFVVGR